MTQALTTDDHSLLRAYAASGDAEAFSELARRYAGMVLSVAQRITRSAHDAEDITQTCFLDLAKNARIVTSIPGYLHRAATTRALNLLRDNKTRRAYEAKSPVQNPDLTYQELLPLVDAAIDQLPDELRVPLILHYQQSQSQSDIAAALNLSQPTVSRRLDSAIAQLRKHLSQMGEGAGVAVGGLSTAIATVVLHHTAAPTPPTVLLSALNKIGLAGVGHTAIAATTAPIAKLIAVICFASAFAIALIFLFPRSGTPTTSAAPSAIVPSPSPPTPAPLAQSSSSANDNPDAAAAPVAPPAPAPPTLTSISTWNAIYPSAVAALSPDGSFLACACSLHSEPSPPGNDSATSFALYSNLTHERIQSFQGHSRFITAIAFSPDGSLLASASRDGTLRIWDPITGDELHHFEIKNNWFTALAFTPDSKQILAASAFNMESNSANPRTSLYRYDLATEKFDAPFPPFESALITALAISPDSKLLAIATRDTDITVCNLPAAKQLFHLDKTTNTTALTFTSNDHLLTAAQSISLWNLTSRTPDATFPTPDPTSSLSLQNSTLLTGSPNSTITTWTLTIPH